MVVSSWTFLVLDVMMTFFMCLEAQKKWGDFEPSDFFRGGGVVGLVLL